MTTVTFYRDDNSMYYGFEADGHSGFGKQGKDIVCASVSILLQNLCNSIESLTGSTVETRQDPKRGYLSLKVTEYDSKEVQLLFESTILGLTGISGEYPKNLKLTNRR